MRPHQKNCGCEIVTILSFLVCRLGYFKQTPPGLRQGWCGRCCSTSAHSVPHFLRYVLQATRCSGRERPERQFADFSLHEFLIAYWYYSQARRLPHHELHFFIFFFGVAVPGEWGSFYARGKGVFSWHGRAKSRCSHHLRGALGSQFFLRKRPPFNFASC